MGKGRGDDEDEVDVEGVDDAFEDAHQSDDEEYDANAIEEESDDDEADGHILSPSKIKLAKEEKKRLREQKKAQRAELEKMREQQNAAIAKVRRVCAFADTSRRHALFRRGFPSPRSAVALEKTARRARAQTDAGARRSRAPPPSRRARERDGTRATRRDRVARVPSRSRASRAVPVDRRDRARQDAVRPSRFRASAARAGRAPEFSRFAIAARRF